ncbi:MULTISPECIES: hypothetical protein [Kocuria]|jgi:hypothetical protein|uniref:Aldose epimerase n=1 Tax=Kocuria oceani TaxID=988827 RepID=A0ABV9TFT3_9MICC|nr:MULTISPECIES: hypothetical protein [Kocuria]
MSFVHRLLTGIRNDWSVSTTTSANEGAATVSSHPYGASGRLVAVPWGGLQLEATD